MTVPSFPPASLETIRIKAHPHYPTDVLQDCQSALLLFGAGFYGANDGIRFHDAGVERVVCVDTDAERLAVMQRLYPESWAFVTADVWEYLDGCADRFDVISADPPTNLSDRTLRSLPHLCKLARRAVVVGTTFSAWRKTLVAIPGYWQRTGVLARNDEVCWLVWEMGEL